MFNKIILTAVKSPECVFVENGKVLVYTDVKVSPEPKQPMDLSKYDNSVVLLSLQDETGKVERIFKSTVPTQNKPKQIHLDAQQKIVSISSQLNHDLDVFSLETGERIQHIQFEYSNLHSISGVAVIKDECVTTLCIEKLSHRIRSKREQDTITDYYYVNLLINDIKTGQRIGKTCLQIVDDVSKYAKYEISMKGLYYREEKDVLIMTYFQKYGENKFKNAINLFEIPERAEGDAEFPKPDKKFDDWNDNGIDWSDRFVCMCGK